MKLDISKDLAEMIDTAVRFAAMGEFKDRIAFVAAYKRQSQEDVATFCHLVQEIAYGEQFVQEGAAKGEYNPDRFKNID